MPAGDRHHGPHVDAAAVEVDRDDRPGPLRDGGLQPGHVHQQRFRVDVDKARERATACDRFGGGGEGVRDRDHLIAGTDAERPQRQLQGIRAVAAGDRLARAAVGGELSFEVAHLLPLDEVRRGEDAVDRGLDFGSKLRVLRLEVGKRDHELAGLAGIDESLRVT